MAAAHQQVAAAAPAGVAVDAVELHRQAELARQRGARDHQRQAVAAARLEGFGGIAGALRVVVQAQAAGA